MKTALKMPVMMGAMLGLMVPWMMHGEGAIGVAFIAAHGLVVLGIAALAFFIPALRQRLPKLANHRPKVSHALPATIAFAASWAVTCAICLAIGGQHWT